MVFRRSKFQTADVFHVGGLPEAVESHNDGETNGDFSRCDSDYEEDKYLGVVIR
jgi:hypothetical protein